VGRGCLTVGGGDKSSALYTVSSIDCSAPRTARLPLGDRLSYDVVLEKLDIGVYADEVDCRDGDGEDDELTVLVAASGRTLDDDVECPCGRDERPPERLWPVCACALVPCDCERVEELSPPPPPPPRCL